MATLTEYDIDLKRFFRLSSLWMRVFIVLVFVAALLVIISLRARADLVNEKDFSLGKEAQMAKARKLLKADSVDAAFVLLNMVVGDVDAKKKISDSEAVSITDAYLTLGDIHSGHRYQTKYNDYGKAYTSYMKAAEMAEKRGLKPQLAKALLGLAVKYEVQLSSYPDSELTDTLLATLRRSYSLARETESWATMDNAVKNLASAAFSRGRGDEITAELNEYYEFPLSKGNDDHTREFITAYCRTMQAFADEDFDEAFRELKKMEGYSKGHPIRKIDTYSMRAEVLHHLGRKAEAMADLDTVGAAAREVGDLWYDMQIERSKGRLYASLGKKAEADSCLFRYYDCRERLFEDRSAKRIKDLHFMNQIDNVTLEMQKLTLERRHARTLFLVAVIVALIFGVMLVLLVRTNRNLRESHRRIFEDYSRRLKEEERTVSEPTAAVETQSAEKPLDEPLPEAYSSAEEGDEKYKSSMLSERQKDEVLAKIRAALARSESALSSRYQIKDLAAEADENARAISQVINERCGCNFATFLAEHRINTACRRITESAAYRRLTIEAMAASVGIQSRSYFSTTFKKIVGLNPSEYIRQAEQESHP